MLLPFFPPFFSDMSACVTRQFSGDGPKRSSCTVSFNDGSRNGNWFSIGNIYKEKMIDQRKLRKVRKVNVLNIIGCAECFAKWHCRGGCAYAKKGNMFNPLPEENCQFIRTIIKGKLLTAISETQS